MMTILLVTRSSSDSRSPTCDSSGHRCTVLYCSNMLSCHESLLVYKRKERELDASEAVKEVVLVVRAGSGTAHRRAYSIRECERGKQIERLLQGKPGKSEDSNKQ